MLGNASSQEAATRANGGTRSKGSAAATRYVPQHAAATVAAVTQDLGVAQVTVRKGWPSLLGTGKPRAGAGPLAGASVGRTLTSAGACLSRPARPERVFRPAGPSSINAKIAAGIAAGQHGTVWDKDVHCSEGERGKANEIRTK